MDNSELTSAELVISGPDSIVASIPFILGFTPHDSLVVMWLREGCVRLTMRLDLPPAHSSPLPWADSVLAHIGAHDEVIICVVSSASGGVRDLDGGLRSKALVGALLEGLSGTGCVLRDALLIVGDRWWSFLCEEPECCPRAGTPLDLGVADDIAARFALVGVARLPDRESVVAICSPDPARQAVNRSLVRVARRDFATQVCQAVDGVRVLENWRDASIDLVRGWLLSPEPALVAEAEILVALCDIRVRDTVLWEVAHCREHDAHRAFDRAADLLRGAPFGVVAPIGAVTAVLAWLIGDGVRAGAALDRVHDEDPDYVLADLLRRSIMAGLSSSSWLDMMRGLPRHACRGTRPSASVAPTG